MLISNTTPRAGLPALIVQLGRGEYYYD